MAQGPVANVVTTADNTVWYTDRAEIVTGSTPVTYQVYATALRDESAAGNIYSDPATIDADSAETIYVGVGNWLTVTGTNWTGTEIGAQTSAQAGVGGYGVNSIAPPPPPPTPAPTIASISPNVGVFTGNTVVTIAGNNFVNVSGVTFGGASAANVAVANVTSLTARTPSGTVGAPVNVAVIAAAGTATSSAAFTYTAPAPTITSITPNIGADTGSTLISLVGTNYISVVGVTVGGANATSLNTVSANLITARTPGGSVGNVDVTVTALGGAVTSVNSFEYMPTTEPEINTGSSIIPAFSITPGAPYPSTGDVAVGWTINFGSNNMPTGQYVIVVRGAPENPSPTTQLQIQTSGGILNSGISYTFTAPVTPPFPVTPYYRLQPGSGAGPGNVNIYLDLTQNTNTTPNMSNIATGWSIYGASRGLSALGTVISTQTTGNNVRVLGNFTTSTSSDFSLRFAPP